MLSREEYLENILDHHDNPRNRRHIAGAEIEASGGNPGCGDIVVIYAKLGPDGQVADASFDGEGCTISQAAASMLTEELVGKSLDDVLAMTYHDVIEDMGKEVVSSRTRCATLALSTAKAAIEDYQKQQRLADTT